MHLVPSLRMVPRRLCHYREELRSAKGKDSAIKMSKRSESFIAVIRNAEVDLLLIKELGNREPKQ